ncbi:MAG TPA: NAD(P)/FAD-dependent oxidoreductase [Tepidisphaeraceae bacterium]|jgi:flavin-dependent dehydrogenase|nr:NAD(P)/FAD-dependent oxidoreductase [Tepidisphaeraceae bacterium]
MPDATIIGAGPAGCIAALILARAGWKIRLVEQHRYPRDKVCGECLSALGMTVLTRLGLSDRFKNLQPICLTQTLIHSPDGNTLSIPMPHAMWGISRSRLDQWLLNEARAAGAEILQPARCEQIRPHIILRDLITNEMSQFDASWTLLADGKCLPGNHPPPSTADLGIKAHFTHITGPRDAIELFTVTGHYGGVAPIENNLWNIAFSVPQKRIASCRGNIDQLFTQILQENKTLQKRFSQAQRIIDWLAAPLPRFAPSRPWPPRIIPLGNTAAALEPIGGEGIGLAMRSAQLAAQMLLSGQYHPIQLQNQYKTLWRTRTLTCRAAGLIVSQPNLSNCITPKLKRLTPLTRGMMMLMGKN